MPSACCLLQRCHGCPWPLPAGWADACGKEVKRRHKRIICSILLSAPCAAVPSPPSLATNLFRLCCKLHGHCELFRTASITFLVQSCGLTGFYSLLCLLSVNLSPSPVFISLPQSSVHQFLCSPGSATLRSAGFMWAIDTSCTALPLLLSLLISGLQSKAQ